VRAYLSDSASAAQLLGAELLEARDDAAARGDGDELQLHAAHPAHRGQLVLEQQVVSLVVEAPLADHQVGARVLALLHHRGEIFLLARVQAVVCLLGGDIQLMLSLGLWGLERARQDTYGKCVKINNLPATLKQKETYII
jgi:hypothetical protein